MTIDISNNDPRISYTVAAGVTQTSFAVPFEFFDDSDVNVYVNEVLKTITTDYTISGGDGSTGTVTISVTGPATVTLTRDITIERVTDFPTGIDINRAALNTQLDTLTAIAADLKDEITRNIRVSDADTATNLTLPSASNRADKVLSFDTEGNVQTQNASDLFSGSILGANYVNNTATGDGSTVAFGVSVAPGSKNNIQIYIDGVYQNKATFSISGSTVTFSEAPPLNAAIEFIIGSAVTSISGDADGVTYTQGGTGSQQRTVESKLQETVSVKDFGAVGDGVTDDTAAIQAAINHCEANAVSSLYFPTALGEIYNVTSTLVILRGDMHLFGFGGNLINNNSGGYIKYTGTGPLFDYGNSTSTPTTSFYVTGLAFKGSGAGNGQTCFKLSNANNGPHRPLVFRDCSIKDFANAFWFDTPAGTLAPSFVDIQSCIILQCIYAILADDTVLGLRYVGNVAENGARILGKIDTYATITNNLVESNDNWLTLSNTGGAMITVEDNYYEDMGGDYTISLGTYSNQANSVYTLGASYASVGATDVKYKISGSGTVHFERNGGADRSSKNWIYLADNAELLTYSSGCGDGYRVQTTTVGHNTASSILASEFVGRYNVATLRNTAIGAVTCLTPHGITSTAALLTTGYTGSSTISKSGSAGDLVVVSWLMRFTDTTAPSGWSGSLVEIYADGTTPQTFSLITGTRISNDWVLATATVIADTSFTTMTARIRPYADAASGAGCYVAGVAGEVYNNPADWEVVQPLYPVI